MMIIELNGEKTKIRWRRYPKEYGGRLAFELLTLQGEPCCTATVNIPEAALADDEVLIKDWSESAGVLAALEKAGVVKATGRVVPTGFVEAAVCKLLIPHPPLDSLH